MPGKTAIRSITDSIATMKPQAYLTNWGTLTSVRLQVMYIRVPKGGVRHPFRCGKDNLGYSMLAHAPLDLVVLALGGNDLRRRG